ncbi:cupin domain-containing protein [Vibrio renipiscarius]|uniref:cupin domain-containing protein n=1 Tax=Vibrio renipiscarius TaxID=1461322 RepID=UPI00354FC1ED
MNNLLNKIPDSLPDELFEELVNTKGVRIERIVSHGHTSPEEGWYDQTEHEWVLVLSGFGVIEYDDGQLFQLKHGDYLNIPAHQKHRVAATSSQETTVWLAVFYPA